MDMSKRNLLFILFILISVSGIFTYFQTLPSLLEKKPTLLSGKILQKPIEIVDFELIDQDKLRFSNDLLIGKWTVVFFGYTNCPDVCPTTIYKLAGVKEQINKDIPSNKLNTVLVTLDPERDNPERLKEYIGYFDETMLGLTGRQEDIQSFTSSLSVFYQRINKEDGYDFNHTASIFVFNPEGLLFATMSPANTMAELSEDFSVILSNF